MFASVDLSGVLLLDSVVTHFNFQCNFTSEKVILKAFVEEQCHEADRVATVCGSGEEDGEEGSETSLVMTSVGSL
jgi:hypothetical protein